MICGDTPTHGWLCGLFDGSVGQWVGSGQMTNLIKLELINIIWFSLKIYNLSRHPHLWVDGCINGWAHVKPLKSNKSWPNQHNSIMDILDILLDILLKPPQPFIGLFFSHVCVCSQEGVPCNHNPWCIEPHHPKGMWSHCTGTPLPPPKSHKHGPHCTGTLQLWLQNPRIWDLTVQGSPLGPTPLDIFKLDQLGPPNTGTPGSDIWWSILETCSNLFIWGPFDADIWWLLMYYS